MRVPVGEAAGVLASVTWAVSSLIWSRIYAPAAAMNLFKNAIAAVLFSAALGAMAIGRGEPLLHAGRTDVAWLVLSGVVGIVLGDTCYFKSLQALGPRKALVLATIAPPLAAAGAWLDRGEALRPAAWIGMALTLAGVVWVVTERSAGASQSEPGAPAGTGAGVACGIVAALCQALGMVWSKRGMGTIGPLEACFVRLVAAAAGLLVIVIALGRLGQYARSLMGPGVAARIAAASALGTFAGIWLSLTAAKYAPVAIATTLTTLSPIFVIPLARIFLAQRVTARALAGAALAVAGVAVMTWGAAG